MFQSFRTYTKQQRHPEIAIRAVDVDVGILTFA